MAMGAVLGITAFGRTQEKIAGVAAIPTPPTSIAITTPTTSTTPSTPIATVTPIVESQPQVTTGFNGKLAPPVAAQPQI
jgi:hypothetical protein